MRKHPRRPRRLSATSHVLVTPDDTSPPTYLFTQQVSVGTCTFGEGERVGSEISGRTGFDTCVDVDVELKNLTCYSL